MWFLYIVIGLLIGSLFVYVIQRPKMKAFVSLDELKVPPDPYSVSHIIFGRPTHNDNVFYFYSIASSVANYNFFP